MHENQTGSFCGGPKLFKVGFNSNLENSLNVMIQACLSFLDWFEMGGDSPMIVSNRNE